jgi:hypothetical protein
MRWLFVVLVACSSGSSARTPARAPAPAPVHSAGPKPAAAKIEPGHPVERSIRAGEVHRYRVELAAGNVVTGVVTQKGVDVMVVTFDAAGTKIAEFDSPNFDNGPEPFVIEASVAGSYDFEVRPFAPPPGGTEPAVDTRRGSTASSPRMRTPSSA